MSYTWQRRTVADRRLWAFVIGLLLLGTGWIIPQLHPDNPQLNNIADVSQVVGVVIAIATALFTLARLAQNYRTNNQGVADWAAELGTRVRRAESDNLLAMVGNVRPADLTLAGGPNRDDLLASTFVLDDKVAPVTLDGLGKLYTNAASGTRLVIIGEPGSGKTVTSVRLILWLLDPQNGYTGAVPVRFNLASWDTGEPISRYFARRVAHDYKVPLPRAEDLVEQGRILPILDGLDEMDLDGDEPARAVAATAWLNERHVFGGEPASAVLTCRRERYADLVNREAGVAGAHEVRVLELEPEQIAHHIQQAFESKPTIAALWEPVLESLRKPGNAAMWALLSTPWKLTLAVTAAQAGRDPRKLFSRGENESVIAASERIRRTLLAGYVSAATTVAEADRAENEAPRYTSDQATRYLSTLARQLQAPDSADRIHPVIDIVPHQLYATSGVPRILHSLTAGLLLAVGCVAVALESIGPPADWLRATRIFLSEGSDSLIEALFGQIIPFAGLIGAPLAAGWLASATAFPSEPRIKAAGRWGQRYRRGVRLALPGSMVAVVVEMHVAGSEDVFDIDTWSGLYFPELWMTVALVATLALGALLWGLRRRALRIVAVLAIGVLTLLPEILSTDFGDPYALVLAGYAVIWSACLAACFHWTRALADQPAMADASRRRSSAILISAAIVAFPIWLAEALSDALYSSHAARGLVVGSGAAVISGALAAVRHRGGGGTVTGVSTGFCVGLVFSTAGLVFSAVGIGSDLVAVGVFAPFGLAGCLLAGVAVALLLREPLPPDAKPQLPMAVLRNDLRSAVQVSVAIGVPTFIAFASGAIRAVGLDRVGPATATFIAVAAGAAFGLFGRRSWFRYAIGLGLAAARDRLPLSFAAFLRWASAAGLLRTSGSAYQFRHLELQQWLLKQDDRKEEATPPERPVAPGSGRRSG